MKIFKNQAMFCLISDVVYLLSQICTSDEKTKQCQG